MQKPLRELGRLVRGSSSQQANSNNPEVLTEVRTESAGLPLLQVWPSDSPKRATEESHDVFLFPDVQDNINDSGIDSIQASPSPTCIVGQASTALMSSSTATTPQQSRRPSLLHPNHARVHLHPLHHHRHSLGNASLKVGYISPDRASIDEEDRYHQQLPSPSSSTTGSIRSMPSSAMASMYSHERRRSSRYSMFDAVDLEYAFLRAAARGSVGPYSLSESLHKLTFTQSLAFPGLAQGLASKHNYKQSRARRTEEPVESGMNAFAKVVTALVLVLVSVLVFGVVYKFVRT